MKIQTPETKEDLQKRLRRIEGQIRGIQRMLDEDRDCREIVQQLSASQAALRSATNNFVHGQARECLLQTTSLDMAERAALVDDLFNLIGAAG